LVVSIDASVEFDADERDLADWLGTQGWQVDFVLAKDLERGRVRLDRSAVVVGSIPSVRAALRILGADLPDADDYPNELGPHFHRRIWSSTVGKLRAQLEAGTGDPVFAKPKKLKRFPGRVFDGIDDVRFIAGVSARQEIWCSEVVDWAVNGECSSPTTNHSDNATTTVTRAHLPTPA
jgi:hypothetical protein